jgi:hypothetical protein
MIWSMSGENKEWIATTRKYGKQRDGWPKRRGAYRNIVSAWKKPAFSDDEIQRVIDPLESFHLQKKEEVES